MENVIHGFEFAVGAVVGAFVICFVLGLLWGALIVFAESRAAFNLKYFIIDTSRAIKRAFRKKIINA